MSSEFDGRQQWLGNPIFTSSLRNWHRWVACHSQAYWRCQTSLNQTVSHVPCEESVQSPSSELEFLENYRLKRADTPVRLIDIRYCDDNVTSASEKMSSIKSKHENVQETAVMRYGDDYMKHLTLNNAIDSDFNSFVASKKPTRWPVIPFNL